MIKRLSPKTDVYKELIREEEFKMFEQGVADNSEDEITVNPKI